MISEETELEILRRLAAGERPCRIVQATSVSYGTVKRLAKCDGPRTRKGTLPTPQQINDLCAEIREKWTPKQEYSRCVTKSSPITVCVVPEKDVKLDPDFL